MWPRSTSWRRIASTPVPFHKTLIGGGSPQREFFSLSSTSTPTSSRSPLFWQSTRTRTRQQPKRARKESVKLKRRPEDFVVEEVTETFRYGPGWGPITVYQLEKKQMETQHALYATAEAFGVGRDDVHFGGLKDKNAVTTQFITIEQGPPRSYQQDSFQVTYVGEAKRHFTATDIAGNRFRVILRNIDDAVVPWMEAALEERKAHGFPNYYGAQRFGSVGFSGEFVGRLWCEREWERALHLLFTEEHEFEKSAQRQWRELAAVHWGEWKALKEAATEQIEQIKDVKLLMRVLDYLLENPHDPQGAFLKFPKHLRAIWLSAYQSHIWNRMGSHYLQRVVPSHSLTSRPLAPPLTSLGGLAFPLRLSEEQTIQLQRVQLPMISKRTRVSPQPLVEDVIGDTLGEMNLRMEELNVPHPRDCFFTNIDRDLLTRPRELSYKWVKDELYPGRNALHLHFILGRGVYATTFFSSLHALAESLARENAMASSPSTRAAVPRQEDRF